MDVKTTLCAYGCIELSQIKTPNPQLRILMEISREYSKKNGNFCLEKTILTEGSLLSKIKPNLSKSLMKHYRGSTNPSEHRKTLAQINKN